MAPGGNPMTREPGDGSVGSKISPLNANANPMERAFQLARSGSCTNVQEIRQQLRREGFTAVESHLSGPSVAKQLRGLIKASRANSAAQDVGPRVGDAAGGVDGAEVRTET